MSVELPEALVLARQMDGALRGKRVASCELRDCERLQRIGFVQKDPKAYRGLMGGRVVSVASRGATILVRLDNGANLIVAPEYGGVVRLLEAEESPPARFHLRLGFTDGSALTVRLTGMGCLHAFPDKKLAESYIYRRDFQGGLDPVRDKEFTFPRFARALDERGGALKAALVGKDAVVVGLGDVAFQEILFRARIHPKKKVSDFRVEEKRALYAAVRAVLRERVRNGGKEDFVDLFGTPGKHKSAIDSSMKGRPCPACGTPIAGLPIGGGPSYFCPSCQK